MKILHVLPLSRHKSTTIFGSLIVNYFNDNESEFNTINEFIFCCDPKNDLSDLLKEKLNFKSSDRLHYCYSTREVLLKLDEVSAAHIYFHELPSFQIQFRISINRFFNPTLRYSWITWGGDLYNEYYRLLKGGRSKNFRDSKEYIKHQITRFFVRHLNKVFLVPDDIEVFEAIYKNEKVKKEYFRYPNHTLTTFSEKRRKNNKGRNILISHSAGADNNHKEALDRLAFLSTSDVTIFALLSYGGDEAFVNEIEKYGVSIFGERFVAIKNFMGKVEYQEFISNIDIAFFALDRQAAIGSIFTMLSSGVKVYYKSSSSPSKWFSSLGLKINDTLNVEGEAKRQFLDLDIDDLIHNSDKVVEEFCEEKTLKLFKSAFS